MNLLAVPVPPTLENALGYGGPALFVAFSWLPGEECVWLDGCRRGIGSRFGYLGYVRHRAVAPGLEGQALGSGSDGTNWLLLDRRARKLHIVLDEEARQLLRHQWGDAEAGPVLIGPVVWAATIDFLRRPPTPEVIAEGIKRQAEVEAEMLAWLDRVAAERNGKHEGTF